MPVLPNLIALIVLATVVAAVHALHRRRAQRARLTETSLAGVADLERGLDALNAERVETARFEGAVEGRWDILNQALEGTHGRAGEVTPRFEVGDVLASVRHTDQTIVPHLRAAETRRPVPGIEP
jgi:hypothetical protein